MGESVDDVVKLALRVGRAFEGSVQFRDLIRSTRLISLATDVLVEDIPPTYEEVLMQQAQEAVSVQAVADAEFGPLVLPGVTV